MLYPTSVIYSTPYATIIFFQPTGRYELLGKPDFNALLNTEALLQFSTLVDLNAAVHFSAARDLKASLCLSDQLQKSRYFTSPPPSLPFVFVAGSLHTHLVCFIQSRSAMHMCCLDGVGRGSGDWVGQHSGSRHVQTPPLKGEESIARGVAPVRMKRSDPAV